MKELFAAIVADDEDAIIATLRGRSERERLAAAKVLVPLARSAMESHPGRFELDADGGLEWVPAEHYDEQFARVNLAIVGTASLGQLRRYGRYLEWLPGSYLDVLLERRPPWLNDWAQWALTSDWLGRPWRRIRELILAGLIERPPAYLPALLEQFWHRHEFDDWLADDPDFLAEDVWELIAYTGDRECLRTADGRGAGWFDVCRTLDRDRLLDTLLVALGGDLSAYAAVWHTKLWHALRVTPDERAARTDALCALLGAHAESIASFATAELARPGGAVAPAALAPALAASGKTIVRTALKLLDHEPALAAIALAHPAADIQGEVLDRLERWGLDDAARDALLRHLDLLAATQRPRAEALLNLKGSAPPVPELPPARVVDGTVLDVPSAPIATVEELVAEWRSTHDDERVLAAVLRFCDQPAPRALADRYTEPSQRWTGRTNRVVHAWVHRDVRAEPTSPEGRAGRGVTSPWLALPTHAGGWIDPLVLVARMHEHAGEEELARALLRLAPDRRGEALDAARDIPGRHGELLRCALGGEPVTGGDEAAVAARAVRTPPLVDVRARVWYGTVGTRDAAQLYARVDPPIASGPLAFPSRRDVAAAHAIARLWGGLSRGDDVDTHADVLFHAVLGPREPIAPLVLRLAVLALGSVREREHLLATDVLVATIEDGRVTALPCDDVVHIKPNRLAARLTVVAEAGPRQRAVVRDLLDAIETRAAPLLVLFDELCAQTGSGPLRSRAHLQTITGSSQAAKAARALLRRPSNHNSRSLPTQDAG